MKKLKWILELVLLNLGFYFSVVISLNNYDSYLKSFQSTIWMPVLKGILYLLLTILCCDIFHCSTKTNRLPEYLLGIEAVVLMLNPVIVYFCADTKFAKAMSVCSGEFVNIGCILLGAWLYRYMIVRKHTREKS